MKKTALTLILGGSLLIAGQAFAEDTASQTTTTTTAETTQTTTTADTIQTTTTTTPDTIQTTPAPTYSDQDILLISQKYKEIVAQRVYDNELSQQLKQQTAKNREALQKLRINLTVDEKQQIKTVQAANKELAAKVRELRKDIHELQKELKEKQKESRKEAKNAAKESRKNHKKGGWDKNDDDDEDDNDDNDSAAAVDSAETAAIKQKIADLQKEMADLLAQIKANKASVEGLNDREKKLDLEPLKAQLQPFYTEEKALWEKVRQQDALRRGGWASFWNDVKAGNLTKAAQDLDTVIKAKQEIISLKKQILTVKVKIHDAITAYQAPAATTTETTDTAKITETTETETQTATTQQ